MADEIEKKLHVGFEVYEKNSVASPDQVFYEDIKVLNLLYGFTQEQMEVALTQGRAENDNFFIEPMYG